MPTTGPGETTGPGQADPGWTEAADALWRVRPGFRLADVDPAGTPGFEGGKRDGAAALAAGAGELGELQERLFAASTQGATDRVLLILQGMDTAGKGGVVRHVMGSVEPQGVALTAFKRPTAEEAAHDFLWRIERRLPAPGIIGVFDRSHYEDVLIQRVRGMASPEEIERRYGAIARFESALAASGCRVLKVMLRIGRDEQKSRLLARLDAPEKRWKYTTGDLDERLRWDAYEEAYQAALDRTSAPSAPWYVVPADAKWYARLAVQRLLIGVLREIDPRWPAVGYDVARERERLLRS